MSALSFPGGDKTSEQAKADVAKALSGITVADLRAMSASEVRALNLNTSFP